MTAVRAMARAVARAAVVAVVVAVAVAVARAVVVAVVVLIVIVVAVAVALAFAVGVALAVPVAVAVAVAVALAVAVAVVGGVAGVGTLPEGYLRNVPLPQVTTIQRARSHQVTKIPDYYKTPYVIPTYGTTRSLVESAAYAFSPAWHAIAINT